LIASNRRLTRLNALQTDLELNKDVDENDVKVSVPSSLADQYDYGRNSVSASKAQEILIKFPRGITRATKQVTVFIASVVAEPSRYSVSHITNMLILEAEQKPPSRANVFESLSMTRRGSDPHGRTSRDFPTDPRLIQEGDLRVPEQVTSRDLSAVTEYNPTLRKKLKDRFDGGGDEGKIIEDFIRIIKDHLNLPNGS
jgi:hypothetical protein